MDDKRGLKAVLLIIVLGAVLYLNSIEGRFIWDDEPLIRDNVFIKSWAFLPDIFLTDVGAGSGNYYGFYRPLQILSYALDYSVWMLEPAGYQN